VEDCRKTRGKVARLREWEKKGMKGQLALHGGGKKVTFMNQAKEEKSQMGEIKRARSGKSKPTIKSR